MFNSPEHAYSELTRVGYITDSIEIAQTVNDAEKLHRALLLEGPAGGGKTELALAVARATGRKFIRLQCYPGIEAADAFGRFSESLREVFLKLAYAEKDEQGNPKWTLDGLLKEICSHRFFLAGPLFQAITSPKPCVLLIDEVDKVPYSFEAFLLEFLSAWELSIPELGTIEAASIPFVVLTSNAERELGDALRRRCVFAPISYPTPEQEARIIRIKTPNCDPKLHFFMAGLAKTLRVYRLKKPPSISEMSDLARTLESHGKTELLENDVTYLPFIAKTQKDRNRLLMNKGEGFSMIVRNARREGTLIQQAAMKAAEVGAIQ